MQTDREPLALWKLLTSGQSLKLESTFPIDYISSSSAFAKTSCWI